VLRDGQPFASALVLSHEDQLRQLAENAPEALSTAVVAGDPCFDRIAASVAFRARYRAALGVGDRTLVLVSSTWSPSSLLGSRPELLRELVAEFPLDTHVVAVALHPNIAHGHGPGQLTHWFADCLRSGMIILPEIDGWRAGVIAADVVVGDHGSVTGYSAAIGRPVLLAAFDDVPPANPIAALGDIAPRLPALGPFAPHLAAAIQSHRPTRFAAVADLVTSVPGQSLQRLRSLFYQLLELAEPPAETPVDIVPVPVRPASRFSCLANLVSCQVDERRRLVRLVRHAAEVQRPGVGYHRDRADDAHLSCSLDYPIHSLVVNSAVLAVTGPVDLPAWQEIFDQRPACMIIATLREGGATLRHRDGTVLTLRATTLPADALASVAYAWQATGRSLQSLAPTVQVELGGPIHDVTVTVSAA